MAIFGIHSRPSGCNFRLEWFVWTNGTGVTCQMPRFGDGGLGRCSMGPKRSLECVFFSLKSSSLRAVQWHVLSLQYHQVAVITGWNGLFRSMGQAGHVRHLDLVMGAMRGAQWVPNDHLRGPSLA